jgi:hypothetical protein
MTMAATTMTAGRWPDPESSLLAVPLSGASEDVHVCQLARRSLLALPQPLAGLPTRAW